MLSLMSQIRGTYLLEQECQLETSLKGAYSHRMTSLLAASASSSFRRSAADEYGLSLADIPGQDIRCCMGVDCEKDSKYNPDGVYACMNTYKSAWCFGGKGVFIP